MRRVAQCKKAGVGTSCGLLPVPFSPPACLSATSFSIFPWHLSALLPFRHRQVRVFLGRSTSASRRPAFQPPPFWQVPRESAVFWESMGRYRMIGVCNWQGSIDCVVWEASSFTDGVDQPLQDEMRRRGWQFQILTEKKSGRESFVR